MNWHSFIDSMRPFSPIERLGWALLHSLWQDTAIALLLAIVLLFMRRASASRRYAVLCAALLLMAVVPIITAALLLSGPSQRPRDSRAGHGASIFLQPIAQPSTPAAVQFKDEQPPFHPALLRSLSYAWLIGIAAMSLWNLLGWLRVRRIKRRSTAAPAHWEQVLNGLSRQLRLKVTVRLRVCQRLWAPAVLGCLRPIVLVPASALTELPPHHLEALLAHELAHVRRHDYLVNLIQITIETVLFYHPAVWWVGSRIRQEREHCCDDIAASLRGSPVEYARALAALAELRIFGMPALALSSGGGRLLKRIERLISPGSPITPGRPMGAAIATAVTVAALPVLMSFPRAVAQSTGPADSPATSQAAGSVMSAIRPDDLVPSRTDYRISRNDLVSVSIADLNGPNSETIKQSRVTESGNISMPYLDQPIHAEGLTEMQLEQAIIAAYKGANLIAHAQVSVTTVEARGRAYRILGSVKQPGEYAMVESDFRLLDAIAQAKGTAGPVETVRVVRHDQKSGTERLIEVPAAKLLAGDAKVNLVIRPGDVVLVSGGDTPTRPGEQRVVRLVVGKEMIFQGRKSSWEEIATALAKEPDRGNLVLEIAPESQDVTVGQFFEAQDRAGELVRRYGLKYLGVSGVARAAGPKAAKHADGVCYIGGRVHRPGAYYIHPGETTLGEVIENAGVEAAANSQEVVVLIRHADTREQILELDLQKLLSSRRDRSDPKLIAHPGDQLMVGANPKAKNPAE